MKSMQVLLRPTASAAIGLVLICGAGTAIAEPYAPVFNVAEGAAHATFLNHQRERVAAMVPARADIDVPPYPGAVVFEVHPEEAVAEVIGREGFAEIKLLTADSADRITAFYIEALPDWNYEADYQLFWHGDGEFSLDQLMDGMPNISLQPAGSMNLQMMPDAAQVISIVYRTGNRD